MTRLMRNPDFRAGQREGLYKPHIAPVNQLVDQLQTEGRGWLPHVAPVHGGVAARLLWLLRDPGPAVADPERVGKGFLCVANDDPTAERLCELLGRGRIPVEATLPWNAYPWYVNRAPQAAELRAGVEPLRRLIELLPRLEVVLLLGRHAERSWDLLERAHPRLATNFEVLRTRHPGRQAFIGTADQRATWKEDQAVIFEQAGRVMRERATPG